MKGEIGRLWYY